MSANLITGWQMLERLYALGFTDVKLMRDASYFLPSREWLGNTFAPFLKNEFWQYQRSYIRQKFDCEDFSFESELEADIQRYVMSRAARFALKAATRSLVANSEIGNHGHAFLYVEVGILPGQSLNNVRDGKHATNLVIHPEGESLIEPQNCLITQASDAFDKLKPNEDPNRPRQHFVCTPDWAWL